MLGDLILRQMHAAGIPHLVALSQRSGLSHGFLSRLTRDKASAKLETIEKLADIFGLTGEPRNDFMAEAEAARLPKDSRLVARAGLPALDAPPVTPQPYAKGSKVFDPPAQADEPDLTRAANAMLAEELAALKARLQKVTKERDAERKRAQAAEAEVAVLNQLLSQEMARSVPTPDHELSWEPDTSKLPRLRVAESPDEARSTPPSPRKPVPAAGSSDQSTPLRTHDGR